MPITNVYKADKIVLPSSVEFSKVHNSRVSAEIESLIENPAGHPYPMFGANTIHRPAVSWTTPQLDVAIAAIGAGGLELSSDSYVYVKTATKTGIPSRVSTTHRRFRIPVGLAYWNMVRLPHNGRGDVDLMIAAAWDGTNDPIIHAGTVALSGNLVAGNYFGCGPVYINGVQMLGNQSVEIATNPQLLREGGDSEEFDSFIGIETIQPVITVTSNQPIDIETFGLRGTALNGSNGIIVYGRKYAANGSRVANATAQHISFQGLLGRILPSENTADGTSAKRHQIRCELVASTDLVLPLLVNTNQAIP